MTKKSGALDKISMRDTKNRIETKTRFAMHLTELGKDPNPETRNQKVEQQMGQLEKIINEQVEKGEKLAKKFKEKGPESLDKQRQQIEQLVSELERQLNIELKTVEALNENINFPAIIEQEKERRARKKRTKAVKKTIGPTL